MSNRYVQIDPRDNLIVAIQDLKKNEEISVADTILVLKEDVQAKHKFALQDLAEGDLVYMYGVLVGKATTAIEQGRSITVRNMKHASAEYSGKREKKHWVGPDVSKWQGRTFNGYHRADGKVGTGNYWIVFALTFCENRNLDVLKAALTESLGYQTEKDYVVNTEELVRVMQRGGGQEDILNTEIIKSQEEVIKNRVFPNVDGIKILRHEGGCGGTRADSEVLCNLLAGYLTNPNVAGATVLSLGCQNAQIEVLEEAIKKKDSNFSKPLHILEQQQSKSERSFIEGAVKMTFIGLQEANKLERKPAPLSKLVLGLECGGSDGFSGISANPALGYTSDILAALGGSPVLSEFPELNGVEQELIDRCVEDHDAEKFASLMKAYGDKAIAVGSGFESNPSPGNIKDGLITDAMKSAGAAKKGGTSPISEVLDYTESVTKPGLNLLCTPGNDVESTTGLAGSGCNLIVFTTGLGTPTGNPVVPVVKLSSNNKLSEKMKDVIDVNAGTVISGEDTIESKGEELFEYLIQVASGEVVPHAVRLGHDDFIPWKRDISL
ncbi:UxaA family hydrolase [Reichenbachiella agariperforans]|uniref:UxaA family hydrolase n=1 Tax=Reichenbachiella agariperforans TaxID=156994 RepID=UPI001C08AE7C|nr:altronate dehydratase family protein [Reichenbachiella agariperforans]MBU2912655.1 altronate dehydratase family protein [Reichenbachiella agariperforans]